MKVADARAAIEAGATTSTEIAEHVGADSSTARRYLKRHAQDPETDISRERQGNGYVYGIEIQDTDTGHEGMPVLGDREYEWAQYVPAPGVATYLETDGELGDITAILDERHTTGQLPRFRLTGPPGTGKTTLARHLAAERQWPMFSIQFTASMRDSELLGSPHLIGGESVWVDGPLTKALLCSRERPCLVVLDEVNRAPFHRKSSLQSFLDHRAQVTLTLLGGEVIQGEALDVATVATMNQGAEYETFAIDPAERRRHANTWEVPFLGLVDHEREVGILTDETPVGQDLAWVLVEAANEVRRYAAEDATSPVEQGIATSIVLEWARTTAAYRRAGRPNPILHAAKTAIVEPHYQDRAADEVEAVLVSTVRDHVGHDTISTPTSAGTGDD